MGVAAAAAAASEGARAVGACPPLHLADISVDSYAK